MSFSDDAINYLATRTNQFRQLVKLINKIENYLKLTNLKEIDEQLLKGILNERPSSKVMSKIEKLYTC